MSPFADDWTIFRVIRAVQRAPSVYNTQPWSFWIRADNRFELRPHMAWDSDRGIWHVDRRLPHTDAAARELTISCGAALFNLRMAIRVTGHQVAVWLLPNPVGDPRLLASVEIMTGRITPPTAEEQDLYDAIQRRHTYRGPFTGRRVPHNIITELLSAAAKEEGWLRELYPFQVTDWLYDAARAEGELTSDQQYLAELSHWTDGAGPGLGVPPDSYGPLSASPNSPVRYFGPPSRPVERFESRPQLLSLATDYNRPLDWLRAGQALQRSLLTAAHYGVAASFLTQSLELADHHQLADNDRLWPPDDLRLPDHIQLADNRRKSRRWPNPNGWPFEETPQMLIRVGYPDRDGPLTPREDAPEVIDLRNGWPRPVPPPDRPGWVGPGRRHPQIH